jgi:ATP-binding cassette subfamily D (ALD) protein 3
MEGQYRATHNDLINHSEEIAFYNGNDWEKKRINNSFGCMLTHYKSVIIKKFYMGIFDSMLVKYGATTAGYAIVGLPVFGPRSAEYIKKVGSDPSAITRDYVRNTSLLINLAKAIGKIVVSYREVQALAGYTSLIYELQQVLGDLETGNYQKAMVTNNDMNLKDTKNFGRGEVRD